MGKATVVCIHNGYYSDNPNETLLIIATWIATMEGHHIERNTTVFTYLWTLNCCYHWGKEYNSCHYRLRKTEDRQKLDQKHPQHHKRGRTSSHALSSNSHSLGVITHSAHEHICKPTLESMENKGLGHWFSACYTDVRTRVWIPSPYATW